MLKLEDLKIDGKYHHRPNTSCVYTILGLGKETALISFYVDLGHGPQYHEQTYPIKSILKCWKPVPKKITKKFFFYVYTSHPNEIYTATDASQYYPKPVSIEESHKELKNADAISWVSDIFEKEIELPDES